MKITCDFCQHRTTATNITTLPKGWGAIHAKQGQAEVNMIHCPKHHTLIDSDIWTLIAKAKPVPPSPSSPMPF